MAGPPCKRDVMVQRHLQPFRLIYDETANCCCACRRILELIEHVSPFTESRRHPGLIAEAAASP